MPKKSSNLFFIIISLAIILSIFGLIFYKLHINNCNKVKADFIHTNLPSEYGPTVTIEKRIEDTNRINKVYNHCLYPWK